MEDEPLDPLPFGTRVEISGRTMLRPGFSLVGLTGMVYLPAPGVPPGCTTVIIDWKAHGYTPEAGYPEETLPPLVNVPTQHLQITTGEIEAQNVEAEPQVKPKFVPRPDRIDPRTGRPADEGAPPPAATKNEAAPDDKDDDEPPRPALRLV